MTDKELLKKFNEFLEENKTNFVNQINKEDKNLILDFIFYVVLKAERKEIIKVCKELEFSDGCSGQSRDCGSFKYNQALQDIIKSLK